MRSTPRLSNLRRVPRAATLLATLTCLAAPAAAGAASAADGTIAFIQDGDIHVIKPDGTGDRPVTTDGGATGGYASVAWAPDGTLWVSHQQRIEHLTQQGDVLGRLEAPALEHAILPTPFDLDVSPDGTKLSYSKVSSTCEQGCTGAQAAGVIDVASGQSLIGTWSSVYGPQWISNTRLATAGPSYSDLEVRELGQDAMPFFNDNSNSMSDLAVSADRQRVAWVNEQRKVTTGFVNGDLLSASAGSVTSACVFDPTRPGGYVDPTFGPDDHAIAFAEVDGIAVVPDAVQSSGTCAGIQGIHTVGRPGAHSPDWADVAWEPVRAPQAPGGGTSTPATTTKDDTTSVPPKGDVTPVDGHGGSTTAAKAKVLSASRSKGVSVRLTAKRAGTARATLVVEGRVVARAMLKVRAGKTATLRLRLSAGARRKVKAGAAGTVKLMVPGAAPTTLKLRLR